MFLAKRVVFVLGKIFLITVIQFSHIDPLVFSQKSLLIQYIVSNTCSHVSQENIIEMKAKKIQKKEFRGFNSKQNKNLVLKMANFANKCKIYCVLTLLLFF